MIPEAERIRQSLFALTAKGIKYDLARIRFAAEQIGNPHHTYQSLHVAGTNGKGSTCAYIESILRTAGYSTGLFTSPHLVAFEERFAINGTIVNEADWLPVYSDLKLIIDNAKLTFFEASMLIGIELFRRKSVDCVIFETGMGGRLDATNIIVPKVSVVTRVAMDHREYLGETLLAIAGEKLGIVKKHVPLVMADPGDVSIRSLVETTCRINTVPYVFISDTLASSTYFSTDGCRFEYRGTPYYTRMTGRFQLVNALCAIEAVHLSGLVTDVSSYQKGIEHMTLAGRFERLSVQGKTVILDVGHNPDAASVLCATLQENFPDVALCFVIGIMADKDYPQMLATYATIAHHIILTHPHIARAASAALLASSLNDLQNVSQCTDVPAAVTQALSREEKIIVITGSFHTVGEALELLVQPK